MEIITYMLFITQKYLNNKTFELKFENKEIPALTFILERILSNSFPLYAHEMKSADYIQSNDHTEIENEFETYLAVFNSYDIGTLTNARNEDHGASIVKNENTAKFKKDGGFKNLYKNLGLKSTDYERIKGNQQEINEKIDQIIEMLIRNGYGQEILFNEIQELKELYPKLSKKTWGQTLKGKLIDLGLSEIINRNTINYIFKELTEQVLRIE